MKLWVKHKPKNRRLEREQLLDVKVRFEQLRKARMRFAGLALSAVFILALVGCVIWRGGEWLLDRFLYDNPTFAIQQVDRQIDVQTDGAIGPEHIRRWTLIKPGQNLLALDLAKVKRDLELVPVIASASVERILPNTLRIRVTEREAVAQIPVMQLRPGGGYEQCVYHIDASGVVFPPLDPRLRARIDDLLTNQLTVISGVDTRHIRAGRTVDSEQLQAALQLIQQFDESAMFGMVDLQRIDVATPDTLRVYTTQGSELTFSLDRIDQQLQRWRLVYDKSQQWGKSIGWLDLSVTNNAPLQLAAAPPSPTVHPKSLKPSRTRKKNV